MELQSNQVIGALVAQDYRTAAVFKKYNIDFCCNGNRTIQDACIQDGIEAASLISELKDSISKPARENDDYINWSPDILAEYIEKKHHRYVEEKTSEIKPYLEKICRVHGIRHPELQKVNEHFNITAGELAMHMKKEELILFPYIKRMVAAKKSGNKVEAPRFGTVLNPIQSMMHEHDTEGERFRKIASLTNNFTTPEDGCNTYHVTLSLLKEFEEDLHLHIHLENNILFKQALMLEQELI